MLYFFRQKSRKKVLPGQHQLNTTNSPNACLAEELKRVGSPKNKGANRFCVKMPAISKKTIGRIKDESQIWVILLEFCVREKNSFSGLNNVRIKFFMKYYSLNLTI